VTTPRDRSGPTAERAGAPVFDAAEAGALAAVLDALIPPSADGRMPGAGALGIAAALDADARRTPPLAEAIRRGLGALDAAARAAGADGFDALPADAREGALRDVAARDPGFLPGLLFHAYAAYYAHPRVLDGLGLEPRPPFPKGYAMVPSDLGRLLARVRGRAPLFRAPSRARPAGSF